jgi:hypothetical protein
MSARFGDQGIGFKIKGLGIGEFGVLGPGVQELRLKV